MSAWLRHFLWTLLSRPVVRAVNWTDDERKTFDSFCRTSCGMKLLEFLRQFVASQTFNAVFRQSMENANAEARGAQRILALLHQLRSLPPDEQANAYPDEDVEPLPSQRGAIDGRRFGLSGGSSAIGR
jgi:hypothetical protein